MSIRKWLGIASPSAPPLSLRSSENNGRVARILEGAGFREYERPEGIRGTSGLPEYRVTDYWDGYPVDEGFTFSKERAGAMMAGATGQGYGAELHVRTDGEWSLAERREQPE